MLFVLVLANLELISNPPKEKMKNIKNFKKLLKNKILVFFVVVLVGC